MEITGNAWVSTGEGCCRGCLGPLFLIVSTTYNAQRPETPWVTSGPREPLDHHRPNPHPCACLDPAAVCRRSAGGECRTRCEGVQGIISGKWLKTVSAITMSVKVNFYSHTACD